MISRRTFLGTMALGAAGMAVNPAWAAAARPRLPLGFATLGTPDWSWETILDFAAEHGFEALELRTLEQSEDLPAHPVFAPGRMEETRRQMAERGVRVASVNSSTYLHHADTAEHEAQLEHARRYIDLASDLGAPYVRVFGDRYPEGESREAVVERVVDGLRRLGTYAGPKRVTVLLESHGDFTDSATLLAVMRRTNSPHVALLWDTHHTAVAGEAPEETARQLMRYVRHVNLKDSLPAEDRRRYVLTGQGEIPLQRQVEALVRGGYRGVYSFEWEKRWHPEIEAPEVAIPHFARMMETYVAALPADLR